MFLSQFLGSYLYLYIWEKMKTFFHCIWEKLHNIGQTKAIFGLGMPPVTGGKSGQIRLKKDYYKQQKRLDKPRKKWNLKPTYIKQFLKYLGKFKLSIWHSVIVIPLVVWIHLSAQICYVKSWTLSAIGNGKIFFLFIERLCNVLVVMFVRNETIPSGTDKEGIWGWFRENFHYLSIETYVVVTH